MAFKAAIGLWVGGWVGGCASTCMMWGGLLQPIWRSRQQLVCGWVGGWVRFHMHDVGWPVAGTFSYICWCMLRLQLHMCAVLGLLLLLNSTILLAGFVDRLYGHAVVRVPP
jgi:hypothetical protein